MDKTIRRVTDLDQQRAENFRYWQSIPVGERLAAVCEVSKDAYIFHGVRQDDSQRLPRTIVRIERPQG